MLLRAYYCSIVFAQLIAFWISLLNRRFIHCIIIVICSREVVCDVVDDCTLHCAHIKIILLTCRLYKTHYRCISAKDNAGHSTPHAFTWIKKNYICSKLSRNPKENNIHPTPEYLHLLLAI